MNSEVSIKVSDIPALNMRSVETDIDGFRDPRILLTENDAVSVLRWILNDMEICVTSRRHSLEFRVQAKTRGTARALTLRAA